VVDERMRAYYEQRAREYDDGSRHQVYKRFFSAPELAAEIGDGHILHIGRWFVAVAAG
jgi:hypothetical protein